MNPQRRRMPVRIATTVATVISLGLAFALGPASPAHAIIPTIGPGSSGLAVQFWQKDLNAFMDHFSTCRPKLAVDGEFGPRTTNATKCFQRFVNISDDGIVGPVTRKRMCDEIGYYRLGGENWYDLYQDTCLTV